jgi:L-threonylcarbamoyladenylate synthase
METKTLLCVKDTIAFNLNTEAPSISNEETANALKQAADVIRSGECVAFPTETVYGLGADATNPDAVRKIFAAKGRPADNPLIVHVSSHDMLHSLLPPTYTPPRSYEILARHFWPGPLTLLYPAGPGSVPPIVTAGQSTVGIRIPAHPVARALIAISGTPLAAPSANTSGRPSPTRAYHVASDMDGRISTILDGGSCDVGLESTVVDGLHPDGALRVLRPGGVTVEDMERVLEENLPADEKPRVLVHRRDYRDEVLEQAPTTPGMKYTHYAPSAPVTLIHTDIPTDHMKAESMGALVHSLKSDHHSRIGLLMSLDSPVAQALQRMDMDCMTYDLGPRDDPAVASQRLFDGLLTLDKAGVSAILMESVPETREGLAFMNRVRKAAGSTRWIQL